MAEKKATREVRAGLVDAYVHSNGKIGVHLELLCETDFVARNPEFKKLAHDLAMHIAAMAPEHLAALEGQDSIHQPGKSIRDVVREAIGKFGENIRVGDFTRLDDLAKTVRPRAT
jgi:elongation factor Ts